MPFFWLLILILILAKRKNLYIYIRLACVIIYISLTPIFSNLLAFPLLSDLNNYKKGENYDFVLVPTAGIFQDFQSRWHASTKTINRVSQAEKLAIELNIPLLVSGGVVNDFGVSEASTVKKHILYKNVLYDHESKNSYETVKNLKNIINISNSKQKVLIITSPKHSLRMKLILSSHGYSVASYASELEKHFHYNMFLPDARTIHENNASLYEYMAILKYIYLQYI